MFLFIGDEISSYTRKSQFQVEEEDIEKLEIRYVDWILQSYCFLCQKKNPKFNWKRWLSLNRILFSKFISETERNIHFNLNYLLI